ncbi:MAG: adenosylmethionine decarboxylase [Myxococcota bacterium]
MTSIPTVGHHVLVELFDCDPLLVDDLAAVRDALLGAVRAIGTEPLADAFHRFAPQGVSGVVLIGESHVSCHTWPERGYVAADIYTCGQVHPSAAVEHLRRAFRAGRWLSEDVVRGLVEFAPKTSIDRTRALVDARSFHTPMTRTADRPDPGARAHILRTHGVVDVTGIVSDDTFARVRAEVLRLLDAHAERRDLHLATTGNTPRYLSVVRSENIGTSPLIRELYASPALTGPLEAITGEPLCPCPKEDEEFLITKHHCRGDTHGWHWGDYRYALIWIVEAPPLAAGGLLQCVPFTRWDKRDPRILDKFTEGPISTYYFRTGQIYLLRTDTTLHRTVPLTEDTTRIILNMTWGSAEDLGRPLEGDDRWWEDQHVTDAVRVGDAG